MSLAGATACAASLDTHDDYDAEPLADGIAHWLRRGEAGTRLPGRRR